MRNQKALAVAAAALLAANTAGAASLTAQAAYSVDMTDYNDEAWAYVAMANDDTVTTGVNIRAAADASSSVVGYLYRGGAVTVLDKGETWTQVQSGGVTGYIQNAYLVYGTQAKGLAEYYGTYAVKASWNDVNVFASGNAASSIISTASDGDTFTTIGRSGSWYEVQSGDGSAYVSSEDVTPVILMDTAVAVDGAQSSAAAQTYTKTDAASVTEETAQTYTETEAAAQSVSADAAYTAYETDSESTGLEAQADALYQTYLNAQSAADDAIANYTSEQNVVDTAAAAQSAYADYVQARNAADEESWGSASYVTADTETTYTETAAAAQTTDAAAPSADYTVYTSTAASTDTSDLSANAQSLYQAYLTAQQAADDAVANYTSEQAVNDTAAAAQAAYAAYVNAQNAADEASWGSSAATETVTQTTMAAAESSYTDASAQVQSDAADTYASDTYSEETYTAATEETESTDDSASYSASDLELLAALIYCEAGNQPYDGQVAVGAVVMNRVASGSFANSISGVIYESGQFTPAYSGALASALASGAGSNYIAAASAALSGEDPTGGCLYFNTSHGSGIQIGDHWFY